jgi:hypothetical protein
VIRVSWQGHEQSKPPAIKQVFKLAKKVFKWDVENKVDLLRAHLEGMGIRAVIVKKGGFSSTLKGVIKIEGRNIDSIEFRQGTEGGEGGSRVVYELVYCISDETQRAGEQVKAKIKEQKTGLLQGEVIDFYWVGGAVVNLLNEDADLKRMLLAAADTKIQVKPDRRGKRVRIIRPWNLSFSTFLPSRDCFEAYDRIARHVRRAMEYPP